MPVQRDPADRRERCQMRQVERRGRGQRAAGARDAVHGQQRMREREGHRPVRLVQQHPRLDQQRCRAQQIGARSRQAQPVEDRAHHDRAAIAGEIGDHRAHRAAAGLEVEHPQLAARVRLREGAVDVRIQRHRLPGKVRPRRHRRRRGGDGEVGVAGRPDRPCHARSARSSPAATEKRVASALRGPSTLACTDSAPRSGSPAAVATSPCAGSRARSVASMRAASMRPAMLYSPGASSRWIATAPLPVVRVSSVTCPETASAATVPATGGSSSSRLIASRRTTTRPGSEKLEPPDAFRGRST